MGIKPRIIAEDVISASQFSSATEEEGAYLGQPEPDDDNAGNLRPVAFGGDFASMALNASVASGDQNTIFKLAGFDIYGDDYFNSCTMRAMKQFEDSGDTGHSPVAEGAIPVITEKKFGTHGIYFDGTNDYISAANHNDWDVNSETDFTISLFAKHTDHIGEETYVSQYEDANNRWLFYHKGGGSDGIYFYMISGGVTIIGTPGTSGYGEIADNNWHHVLMVKKGNEYGLYLDGNQVSYLSDVSMATFTGELIIGQRGGGTAYFNGHMDEVIIYHGNLFDAAPNVEKTDTITVPITEHELDDTGLTKLYLKGNVEERTISDFEQSVGRVTVSSAFGATMSLGESVQITKDKRDVDFRIELIDAGDIGTSSFKWSHNGGDTWLGRHSTLASNWLGEAEIFDNGGTSIFNAFVQAENGDLICCYRSAADAYQYYTKSLNRGVTWETPVLITTYGGAPGCAFLLPSGRILLFISSHLHYSDDNGDTWSDAIVLDNSFTAVVKVGSSGGLLAVYADSGNVYCKKSTTDGVTWGGAITIENGAGTQGNPTVVVAKNGDIVCLYHTDVDSAADYEIKGKISEDGGATWGSEMDVADFVAVDLQYPRTVKDINGDIYCIFTQNDADIPLIGRYSTNNGASWATIDPIKAVGAVDLGANTPYLIDGHELICAYTDQTNSDIDIVRVGMWEAYATPATNSCPTAIESIEQDLICGVKIRWGGYGGIEGDNWTFGPEYYYAKENILLDSPSLFWRSEQDNVEIGIVIDLEENKGHPFNSIGLFGCNIRNLKIQASPSNETKAWELPPVDEEVSFDLDTTGVIDSIVNNRIEDAALLANYSDHELRNHYIQMTNGTANGVVYKIVDNVGDRFEVLSDRDITASVGNTFAIFKPDITIFFSDPDTTEWSDVGGSMEIGGSEANVQNQDIVGNLTLNSTASTNSLARIIVGGNVHCATGSTNNFILGLQCAGTITDNGTGNVIDEGDWFNYPYRYIRILVEIQATYEGYYKIGHMVLGEYTELTNNWKVGYNIDSNFGVELIKTPYGNLTPIRKHNEKKRFNLSWHAVEDTDKEITKLIDYIGGGNIDLIPDYSGDPTTCYLTKFVGAIRHKHVRLNRFNTDLVLEEVK